MNRLFNMDSPLMSFLSKIFDLMLVNILTVICSLPIITIGAALTAMHSVELRNIITDRSSSVVREYFRSFRDNFKQATLTWLLYLLAILVVSVDLWIIRSGAVKMPTIINTMIFVLAGLVGVSAVYSFALLSHYENTVINTLKNAWILLIVNLPRTVLMVLFMIVWFIVLYSFVYQLLPLILLFGISVPGWFNTLLMSQIFKKLDPSDPTLD